MSEIQAVKTTPTTTRNLPAQVSRIVRAGGLWVVVAVISIARSVSAQPPPDTTSVRGKVTQRDGEPVAGAQVTLRRASRPNQATALWGAETKTNEEGEFVFPEVEEGSYTVSVIADEFAEFTSDLLEVVGRKPVTLSPFMLSPQPHVSGRILNARGAPVADTEFRVMLEWETIASKRRELRTTEHTIQTDSDGRYSLPLRGAGTGTFLVRTVGKGWASPPKLTLQQDETLEGVNLYLRRGGDILALVQSKDTGEPVINATVSAEFRPTPTTRLTVRPTLYGRTGNDGKCRFSEVPPGYWTVTAYPADAPFGSARTQIAYVGVEQTAGVMLDVFRGATVSVHVFGPDAQTPLPNASVRLDSGETQVTNEEGIATFAHVGAGDRKVFVRLQGFANAKQAFKLSEDKSKFRVNVVMHTATGSIAGQVRDADGKPVPRAFVCAVSLPPNFTFVLPLWAWMDDGWRELFVQRLDRYVDDAVAEADATGAFVINGLAPGQYILFAPMIRPPDALSSVVSVMEGKVTEGVNVTVDARCLYHISGRVLRADGAPLPHALVRIVMRQNDGKYLHSTRFLLSTDEQGRYFFMRRGQGMYFIEATVEGEGSAKLWRDVRDGEQVANLDLRLRP